MLDFSKFAGRRVTCAGLGEVLFDIYNGEAKLGGAPANFAFHAKQLGLDSVVVSAVGRDELGARARALLALNFLPALVPEVDHVTGGVEVVLSDQGVPSYNFWSDTAYDNLPVTPEFLELAAKTTVACFGTLAQRGVKTREAIVAFLEHMPNEKVRVFDVNLRGDFFNSATMAIGLDHTDIFKCNDDELPVLCRMCNVTDQTPDGFNTYLRSRGIDCFIYTEGARQSTVYLNDEVSVEPTAKVEAVDTVGAGDSFTASIVSLLIRGCSLKEAHKRAVAIAAYVCTQRGAMPVLPAELIA